MKWYFKVGIAVVVVLTMATMVPFPARRVNLLGYKSVCSFAPISTCIMAVISGILYLVGRAWELWGR